MIPKASQRANGQQLAVHLLNAHDNERVYVAEIRGAIARDLPGALKEWHAISRATQCKKYLYSLSVNPDPHQKPLSRAQYRDYIIRVEKKLGLSGQPRAVVFHTKDGRDHCHVVWSRILPNQLKAVTISHDHRALQTLTRLFAKDHGLTLPPNMAKSGKSKKQPPPQKVTLHEKQQQERTGISKEQRMHELTHLWHQTNTGAAFCLALEGAGYHLAKGVSAAYVVIDSCGEIHSLSRQIEAIKTKDVRARLKDYPPDSLPAAAIVKEQVLNRLKQKITSNFNQGAHPPQNLLLASQDRRRAAFHQKRAAMKQKHKAERTDLIQAQKETLAGIRAARLPKMAIGLAFILNKIPFIKTLISRHHKKHDLISLKQFKQERQALITRQRRDFEELNRQARGIVRVEKRELRSLKTKLRRDFLQARITEKFQKAAKHQTPFLPSHTTKSHDCLEAAKDMTAPILPSGTKAPPLSHRQKPREDSLAAAFTERPTENETLRQTFTRHADHQEKHHPIRKNGWEYG